MLKIKVSIFGNSSKFPLTQQQSRKMNPKKKLEVELLINHLKEFSDKLETNILVDIGCGLGYLSKVGLFNQL